MASRARADDPLTQERLRELFHYSPDTGLFTRRMRTGRSTHVGDVLSPGDKGYVRVQIGQRNYFGHRLAWLYMTGEWPEDEVDHRDRDRGNNRWGNLRAATFKQNHENSTEQRNNTSGHRGICWHEQSRKWRARISHNGRRIQLGDFKMKAEAVEIRQLAESMLFTHSPGV